MRRLFTLFAQVAAAEQQSLRWEAYTASSANAVQWHEADKDAADADTFGAALHNNASWRPQMTPMSSAAAAPPLTTSGISGSIIVTGADYSEDLLPCKI